MNICRINRSFKNGSVLVLTLVVSLVAASLMKDHEFRAAESAKKKPASKSTKQTPQSTKTTNTKSSGSTVKKGKSTSSKKKSGHSAKRKKQKVRGQQSIEPSRVMEIQGALAAAGYYKSSPSGQWDDETSKALSTYQQENGFKVTGKPDALSLKKLGL